MALPNLILPQATDNVIQSADIALVGGVEQEFPVVFLVPDTLTEMGQYLVRYDRVDSFNNIASSNPVIVTTE